MVQTPIKAPHITDSGQLQAPTVLPLENTSFNYQFDQRLG
jgi:hypothetical protein